MSRLKVTYFRVYYDDGTRTRRLDRFEQARDLATIFGGSVRREVVYYDVMDPVTHFIHSLRIWWRNVSRHA